MAQQSEILEAAAAIPGMEAASLSTQLPISDGSGNYTGLDLRGPFLSDMPVSRDYFRVFQIHLLSGRMFSDSGKNEVVIDQRAAQELWPGRTPLGHSLVIWAGTTSELKVVVGVVNNTRSLSLTRIYPPPADVYLPLGSDWWSPSRWSGYLLLHCRTQCGDVTPSVLAALKKVGADSYVERVAPVADYGRTMTEPLRISMSLLTFYALMGLALALGGVFVLSSYLSVMRNHEIGIRMALGADHADVVWQIAREGIASAFIGLCAGAILWLGLAKILGFLIDEEVAPLNPVMFATVGALLFAAAALASALPAITAAMRRNPADLLRVV